MGASKQSPMKLKKDSKRLKIKMVFNKHRPAFERWLAFSGFE